MMSLDPKLSTSAPESQSPPPRGRIAYYPESLHRLTGLSLLALAEVPYMNCSTLGSCDALAVVPMAKRSGAGFANLATPVDLTEESLEAMLVEIFGKVEDGKPIAIRPRYVTYHLQMSRHRRAVRGSRMARVTRIEVEEGFCPARCIRGWAFYADVAYVDRRRVKRSLRRHYKESRNVPVRNHGAGHQRTRA